MKLNKKIFAVGLAVTSLIAACGPTTSTNPTNPSEPNSVTTNIDTSLFEGIGLDYFVLVYDDTNKNIEEALTYLTSVVEQKYGQSYVIVPKSQHNERYEFEIIIGNIYDDAALHYNSAKDDDLLILNTVKDESLKFYVGGKTDYLTSAAIYEFADMIKNGAIEDDNGNLLLNANFGINVKDIYFTIDELKTFDFVINKNLKEKVKDTARLLVNDLNSVTHAKETLKEDAYGSGTCNNYTNSFVIGMVNDESFEIASNLGTNQFLYSTVRHGDKYNIYIQGVSDQVIIHSIQNFYTDIVENGEIMMRKYFTDDGATHSRRDPCVVPYNGVYYLYSSNDTGYVVETSTDLKYWSAPKTIFDKSWKADFTGIADFWAPECHYYNGKFYLIATYKSSTNNHRGCGVWVSDTPDGEFTLISDGHITPSDWDAIDGTLYVDKEGQPWMVFVHEWTSTDNGIGRMCYAKLSSDLSRFVEEPVEIFAADDPSWTDECVTDGCYMYRTEDGELLMIWSNFASDEFNNYTIGIAKSSNGEIDGNWIQQDEVLHTFDNSSVYSVFNGGHGMIFEGFDGQKYITFHAPNNAGEWMTYIMFVPIVERNGTIYLDKIVK